MSVVYSSVDVHLTPEGQKILAEAKSKKKVEKAESTTTWPCDHGPTICRVCYRWCYGPVPYKGDTVKIRCKEYKEFHAASDSKMAESVAKVTGIIIMLCAINICLSDFC